MTPRPKMGYHLICAECDRVIHHNSQAFQIIVMKIHENDGHSVVATLGKSQCQKVECEYAQPVDKSGETPK
jgi:hypothetical protein